MFKHFELNENETKHQNLRDIAKVVLRGKSTALMDILENKKKTWNLNLSSYLNKLEKEKSFKPKVNRRRELIKVNRKSMKLKTEK